MAITASVMLWFAFGLGLSLVHGLWIVRAIGRISPGRASRGRMGVFAGYLLRYLTTVLAMAFAVQKSAVACVLVSLGMLVGRWLTVIWGASDGVGWARFR